ncbi:MAG: sulfatase, partial [Bacteroidetes bacterium]|nr:sulfatase [Bacteroidota bacterium]
LIEFFEDSHTELYDLSVDIGEKNNLSETMPEVRDELLLLLHTWQEDVDARFPSPNPYYKPQE